MVRPTGQYGRKMNSCRSELRLAGSTTTITRHCSRWLSLEKGASNSCSIDGAIEWFRSRSVLFLRICGLRASWEIQLPSVIGKTPRTGQHGSLMGSFGDHETLSSHMSGHLRFHPPLAPQLCLHCVGPSTPALLNFYIFLIFFRS